MNNIFKNRLLFVWVPPCMWMPGAVAPFAPTPKSGTECNTSVLVISSKYINYLLIILMDMHGAFTLNGQDSDITKSAIRHLLTHVLM